MSKTIVFRSDRTPQPGRVHVGFETDNMVERLAFVLPQLDAQQTAMLMLGGTYVNMVQLSEGGGVYYVDMTAELIGKAGEAEGYVVVNTPDGRVWNSAPFVLITGDLPDIDGELQEHFPDAIQQMRQEIAEHNAEMAEQAETAHAAVNAAEAAARRSEAAAESLVEKDPTVPEWAKQPNKPTYTPAEVGAPSKQELNVLAAKVDNKQPKGDYALKSEIPNVTGYATEAWVGTQLAGYQPKGEYQPKGDYALKSELPSVPTQLSELAQDATHRLTTDAEKAAWNAKVMTVNGTAPDANGNVQIEAGGGVKSWNDLEDRPFGEIGGDTLTWDGNTEGLESDAINYKVSDAVPSIEDFANDYIVTTSDGESMSGTDADFPAEETDFGIVFQGGMVVNIEGHALSKGVYLYNSDGIYISSLTIPGYTGFSTTKKLDAKYMPGAVVLYVDAKGYLCEDNAMTKRMTREELLNAVLNGKPIYTVERGMYIPVYIIDDGSTAAAARPAFSMMGITEDLVGYTAEYTPTT